MRDVFMMAEQRRLERVEARKLNALRELQEICGCGISIATSGRLI
jgi:hypothetical protein